MVKDTQAAGRERNMKSAAQGIPRHPYRTPLGTEKQDEMTWP